MSRQVRPLESSQWSDLRFLINDLSGQPAVNIPLDGEIEQVVLAKVAAGEYRSVSELVEEALFLLVERDWMAASTLR